jgi:hypothetical protein
LTVRVLPFLIAAAAPDVTKFVGAALVPQATPVHGTGNCAACASRAHNWSIALTKEPTVNLPTIER